MNKKKLKKQIYDIWAEYEPYIRKLCKYKLNSMPDCIDDCVQDVFLDLSLALNEGKTINHSLYITQELIGKINYKHRRCTQRYTFYILFVY